MAESTPGLVRTRTDPDRFYIPQELVPSLQSLSHHPFMSDHFYVRLEIRLPEIQTRRRVKKNYAKHHSVRGGGLLA